MEKFLLNGSNLTSEIAKKIVDENITIGITGDARKNILRSRKLVENWIKNDEVIYGVTTGFGEFKDIKISAKDLEKLQENLIKSHSAGVGECLPKNIIRLMLLLRINSLAKGHSGITEELIDYLVNIFNLQIIPYVPSQGSVGSSGDLAPLAHMALFLIGEGFAFYENEIYPASELQKKLKLKPLTLKAKEGLALINGTQMMTAYAVEIIERAKILSKLADISAALSIEALQGSYNAFRDELQQVRPHKGQIKTAGNLRRLFVNSEINKSHSNCGRVQDAYSMRCIPQVHGAVKETIEYVNNIIEIEINSATDNPLIFPGSKDENAKHIEGGNFHGEPIAFAMDFLKIALAELGSISERRTARLVDGSLSGLPRFLTDNGGLNSGLMIAQYTAASLVSENKILCHPASVDSIVTSANQEDHNSMGPIASRKCFEVLNNVEKVIAIEFLCSCQGIDFLKPLKPGEGAGLAYNIIRMYVPHIESDVIISEFIQSISEVIFFKDFISEIENKVGELEG
ncbi:MAG: histidine ammonia-lyase [Ignavibacteriae bacterium]|nr:MAG: histidine ammonia-lyase [Ignavibacteriota bacterium]